MIRIVLCGPNTPFGPACLADVNYHITLSFRANVTSTTVSAIGGLFGDYPSQMFLLRFMDTINEYTMGESREMFSYPLKLSRDQI